MSGAVTGHCQNCGAPNYGSKFCESCGARYIPPAILVPAQAAAQPRGRFVFWLRVIELGILVVGDLLSSAILVAAINDHFAFNGGLEWVIEVLPNVVFTLLVTVPAIVAALIGRAPTWGKLTGAGLAFAYLVMTAIVSAVSLTLYNLVALQVLFDISDLLLLASWAVSRPFRPLTYVTFGVAVVLDVARWFINAALSHGSFAAVLFGEAAVYIVCILLVVGVGILLERKPRT